MYFHNIIQIITYIWTATDRDFCLNNLFKLIRQVYSLLYKLAVRTFLLAFTVTKYILCTNDSFLFSGEGRNCLFLGLVSICIYQWGGGHCLHLFINRVQHTPLSLWFLDVKFGSKLWGTLRIFENLVETGYFFLGDKKPCWSYHFTSIIFSSHFFSPY